ncbi:complement C3 [Aplysia californica]|uniref:Complement C3 n=1 Tax=Aplysia californica TaxID=6500 RepID=A0ABM0JG96_APLCA|nr:complement C3 [Aplysia californica]
MAMLWLIFLASSFAVLDLTDGAKFLLAVPKEPHYDMEYNVTVTATGIYSRESVLLEYRPGKDRSRILNQTRLLFEFDGVQSWGVVFPWERMQELDETSLQLNMITERNGRTETVSLHFSRSSGYIFIQTDKPVYTPRQTVKFRILAVDEHQRLAKYPLKVDVKNDKMVVVDRLRYSAEEAFQGQEFDLPKESDPGKWSITANYEGPFNSAGTSETVTFEVREYVLPRFYANLEIDERVITDRNSWIKLVVSAKYVYGRSVLGFTEIQFGVWDSQSGVTLLPVKLSGKLKKGKYIKSIRASQLFPKNTTFPTNKRLYVNVNVTEDGTGENDTIEDTSTFITHPYYDIMFKSSKDSFKPGFPYTLQLQVTSKSGTPASGAYVYVTTTFQDKYNKLLPGTSELKTLDMEGKLSLDFDTAKDAVIMDFKTQVTDMKHKGLKTFSVRKFNSPNSQYLHIAMDGDVKKFQDWVILLRYTPPEDNWYGVGEDFTTITVLVISRGQVLYTTSTMRSLDGRSLVSLPKRLHGELTPSMRVVAYFMVDDEVVMDSLLVDTPDVCLEEVIVQKPGGMFGGSLSVKPKDGYKLNVIGGRNMKVGMVAVDKAVLLVNKDVTLSRESMFSQFVRHDQGSDSGDGSDATEIFKNSGLIHRLVDSSAPYNVDSDAIIGRFEGTVAIRKGEANIGPVGPTGPLRPGGFISQIPSGFRDHVKKTDKGLFVAEAPPQTVRKYFPESWLFEEHNLGSTGQLTLNTTLPDSITTWSFLAVGISAKRGVCVSRPFEEKVRQTFFVDLRMPYKVTRLEEVKIKIAIYNFKMQNISVHGQVYGSEGLCFPSVDPYSKVIHFNLTIPKQDVRSVEVKMIPLSNGELDVRADFSVLYSHTRDTVERKLFVVAEGQRVKKSMTFVLDPEAKHATYKRARRNKIILSRTASVQNVIDLRKKEQRTRVDLALPKEVIYGTESCSISAFGDLMGDIISHAVVQSKSLMDQPVLDAEEVLGDLGPTVHALRYANMTGLMDEKLNKRGQRFVKHAVARLLKYRIGHAFRLTPESEPGTWLTAFVTKTLCHASRLTFVDHDTLIKTSFQWLLSQVSENGTMEERDWRLANDSFEYRVMLSAEVLMSLLECEFPQDEALMTLEGEMAFFLLDTLPYVTQPMVLAKATYALTLFDPEDETTQDAVKKLLAMKRKNKQGQSYWSQEEVTNEARRQPYWYRRGPKASSIEATAFGLLVFLKHGGTNIDAIADWLVAQRNANGAFIGALDSTAAIQALSSYSLSKHNLGVNLLCNVSSSRHRTYQHSFKFTDKNATNVEAVNDVPVGQTLQVSTKGKGLGQMQVNLEYNIPLDKNENCAFNITIEVKPTRPRWMEDMNSNQLCSSCNIGCVEKDDNDTDTNTTSTTTTTSPPTTTTAVPAKKMMSLDVRPIRVAKIMRGRKRHGSRRHRCNGKNRNHKRCRPNRSKRSLRNFDAASKKSICFQVCLQHLADEDSGPITVEIEMLTGHIPVELDKKQLESVPGVRRVNFNPDSEILYVHMSRVSSNESTCLGFRAVDEMEVNRPMPATVTVREVGTPYPTCMEKYEPVNNQQSLQVYCADQSNSNRGECRCYSGLCGTCMPRQDGTSLNKLKQMACAADIAYQLQIHNVKATNQWVEIEAHVLSINKTAGSHKVKQGERIHMITPSACYCPINEYRRKSDAFYLLSADVSKLMDRHGQTTYRYLLDHNSHVLRVTDPGERYHVSRKPAVYWPFLDQALGPSNKC